MNSPCVKIKETDLTDCYKLKNSNNTLSINISISLDDLSFSYTENNIKYVDDSYVDNDYCE